MSGRKPFTRFKSNNSTQVALLAVLILRKLVAVGKDILISPHARPVRVRVVLRRRSAFRCHRPIIRIL